jgi:hypothetical protein
MESTPAEELPALYRAILDAVARLEGAGERQRAGRIRRNATAAYSRSWDDRARRRLLVLLRDADRAPGPVPAQRGFRRRDVQGITRGVSPIATQDG